MKFRAVVAVDRSDSSHSRQTSSSRLSKMVLGELFLLVFCWCVSCTFAAAPRRIPCASSINVGAAYSTSFEYLIADCTAAVGVQVAGTSGMTLVIARSRLSSVTLVGNTRLNLTIDTCQATNLGSGQSFLAISGSETRLALLLTNSIINTSNASLVYSGPASSLSAFCRLCSVVLEGSNATVSNAAAVSIARLLDSNITFVSSKVSQLFTAVLPPMVAIEVLNMTSSSFLVFRQVAFLLDVRTIHNGTSLVVWLNAPNASWSSGGSLVLQSSNLTFFGNASRSARQAFVFVGITGNFTNASLQLTSSRIVAETTSLVRCCTTVSVQAFVLSDLTTYNTTNITINAFQVVVWIASTNTTLVQPLQFSLLGVVTVHAQGTVSVANSAGALSSSASAPASTLSLSFAVVKTNATLHLERNNFSVNWQSVASIAILLSGTFEAGSRATVVENRLFRSNGGTWQQVVLVASSLAATNESVRQSAIVLFNVVSTGSSSSSSAVYATRNCSTTSLAEFVPENFNASSDAVDILICKNAVDGASISSVALIGGCHVCQETVVAHNTIALSGGTTTVYIASSPTLCGGVIRHNTVSVSNADSIAYYLAEKMSSPSRSRSLLVGNVVHAQRGTSDANTSVPAAWCPDASVIYDRRGSIICGNICNVTGVQTLTTSVVSTGSLSGALIVFQNVVNVLRLPQLRLIFVSSLSTTPQNTVCVAGNVVNIVNVTDVTMAVINSCTAGKGTTLRLCDSTARAGRPFDPAALVPLGLLASEDNVSGVLCDMSSTNSTLLSENASFSSETELHVVCSNVFQLTGLVTAAVTLAVSVNIAAGGDSVLAIYNNSFVVVSLTTVLNLVSTITVSAAADIVVSGNEIELIGSSADVALGKLVDTAVSIDVAGNRMLAAAETYRNVTNSSSIHSLCTTTIIINTTGNVGIFCDNSIFITSKETAVFRFLDDIKVQGVGTLLRVYGNTLGATDVPAVLVTFLRISTTSLFSAFGVWQNVLMFRSVSRWLNISVLALAPGTAATVVHANVATAAFLMENNSNSTFAEFFDAPPLPTNENCETFRDNLSLVCNNLLTASRQSGVFDFKWLSLLALAQAVVVQIFNNTLHTQHVSRVSYTPFVSMTLRGFVNISANPCRISNATNITVVLFSMVTAHVPLSVFRNVIGTITEKDDDDASAGDPIDTGDARFFKKSGVVDSNCEAISSSTGSLWMSCGNHVVVHPARSPSTNVAATVLSQIVMNGGSGMTENVVRENLLFFESWSSVSASYCAGFATDRFRNALHDNTFVANIVGSVRFQSFQLVNVKASTNISGNHANFSNISSITAALMNTITVSDVPLRIRGNFAISNTSAASIEQWEAVGFNPPDLWNAGSSAWVSRCSGKDTGRAQGAEVVVCGNGFNFLGPANRDLSFTLASVVTAVLGAAIGSNVIFLAHLSSASLRFVLGLQATSASLLSNHSCMTQNVASITYRPFSAIDVRSSNHSITNNFARFVNATIVDIVLVEGASCSAISAVVTNNWVASTANTSATSGGGGGGVSEEEIKWRRRFTLPLTDMFVSSPSASLCNLGIKNHLLICNNVVVMTPSTDGDGEFTKLRAIYLVFVTGFVINNNRMGSSLVVNNRVIIRNVSVLSASFVRGLSNEQDGSRIHGNHVLTLFADGVTFVPCSQLTVKESLTNISGNTLWVYNATESVTIAVIRSVSANSHPYAFAAIHNVLRQSSGGLSGSGEDGYYMSDEASHHENCSESPFSGSVTLVCGNLVRLVSSVFPNGATVDLATGFTCSGASSALIANNTIVLTSAVPRRYISVSVATLFTSNRVEVTRNNVSLLMSRSGELHDPGGSVRAFVSLSSSTSTELVVHDNCVIVEMIGGSVDVRLVSMVNPRSNANNRLSVRNNDITLLGVVASQPQPAPLTDTYIRLVQSVNSGFSGEVDATDNRVLVQRVPAVVRITFCDSLSIAKANLSLVNNTVDASTFGGLHELLVTLVENVLVQGHGDCFVNVNANSVTLRSELNRTSVVFMYIFRTGNSNTSVIDVVIANNNVTASAGTVRNDTTQPSRVLVCSVCVPNSRRDGMLFLFHNNSVHHAAVSAANVPAASVTGFSDSFAAWSVVNNSFTANGLFSWVLAVLASATSTVATRRFDFLDNTIYATNCTIVFVRVLNVAPSAAVALTAAAVTLARNVIAASAPFAATFSEGGVPSTVLVALVELYAIPNASFANVIALRDNKMHLIGFNSVTATGFLSRATRLDAVAQMEIQQNQINCDALSTTRGAGWSRVMLVDVLSRCFNVNLRIQNNSISITNASSSGIAGGDAGVLIGGAVFALPVVNSLLTLNDFQVEVQGSGSALGAFVSVTVVSIANWTATGGLVDALPPVPSSISVSCVGLLHRCDVVLFSISTAPSTVYYYAELVASSPNRVYIEGPIVAASVALMDARFAAVRSVVLNNHTIHIGDDVLTAEVYGVRSGASTTSATVYNNSLYLASRNSSGAFLDAVVAQEGAGNGSSMVMCVAANYESNDTAADNSGNVADITNCSFLAHRNRVLGALGTSPARQFALCSVADGNSISGASTVKGTARVFSNTFSAAVGLAISGARTFSNVTVEQCTTPSSFVCLSWRRVNVSDAEPSVFTIDSSDIGSALVEGSLLARAAARVQLHMAHSNVSRIVLSGCVNDTTIAIRGSSCGSRPVDAYRSGCVTVSGSGEVSNLTVIFSDVNVQGADSLLLTDADTSSLHDVAVTVSRCAGSVQGAVFFFETLRAAAMFQRVALTLTNASISTSLGLLTLNLANGASAWNFNVSMRDSVVYGLGSPCFRLRAANGIIIDTSMVLVQSTVSANTSLAPLAVPWLDIDASVFAPSAFIDASNITGFRRLFPLQTVQSNPPLLVVSPGALVEAACLRWDNLQAYVPQAAVTPYLRNYRTLCFSPALNLSCLCIPPTGTESLSLSRPNVSETSSLTANNTATPTKLRSPSNTARDHSVTLSANVSHTITITNRSRTRYPLPTATLSRSPTNGLTRSQSLSDGLSPSRSVSLGTGTKIPSLTDTFTNTSTLLLTETISLTNTTSESTSVALSETEHHNSTTTTVSPSNNATLDVTESVAMASFTDSTSISNASTTSRTLSVSQTRPLPLLLSFRLSSVASAMSAAGLSVGVLKATTSLAGFASVTGLSSLQVTERLLRMEHVRHITCRTDEESGRYIHAIADPSEASTTVRDETTGDSYLDNPMLIQVSDSAAVGSVLGNVCILFGAPVVVYILLRIVRYIRGNTQQLPHSAAQQAAAAFATLYIFFLVPVECASIVVLMDRPMYGESSVFRVIAVAGVVAAVVPWLLCLLVYAAFSPFTGVLRGDATDRVVLRENPQEEERKGVVTTLWSAAARVIQTRCVWDRIVPKLPRRYKRGVSRFKVAFAVPVVVRDVFAVLLSGCMYPYAWVALADLALNHIQALLSGVALSFTLSCPELTAVLWCQAVVCGGALGLELYLRPRASIADRVATVLMTLSTFLVAFMTAIGFGGSDRASVAVFAAQSIVALCISVVHAGVHAHQKVSSALPGNDTEPGIADDVVDSATVREEEAAYPVASYSYAPNTPMLPIVVVCVCAQQRQRQDGRHSLPAGGQLVVIL